MRSCPFVHFTILAPLLLAACGNPAPGGGNTSDGLSSGVSGAGSSVTSMTTSGGMGNVGSSAGAPATGVGGSSTSGNAGSPGVVPGGGGMPGGVVPGAGGPSGGVPNAGATPGGGTASGGVANGEMPSGGTPAAGQSAGGEGAGGSTVVPGNRGPGPCDIYGDAGNECVGAYSTIRALKMDYSGPLYQVRSGSNAMNTGSGGELHDVGMTAEGFADAAAQDAVCANTTCTVSLIYDQSGRGNDLPVAKAGLTNGGMYAGMDDFESIADAGPLTVSGRDVYSLYMEVRQGYRLPVKGDGVPRGSEPQGLYMLADGTRAGTACCWDFGNVTENPKTYHEMNTLFLGVAYWGRGEGSGPWFGADFEAGVWMGGSNPGEPGWGGLNDAANAPANSDNPSMRVSYALGFLKTSSDYALRMADLETATELHTAYEGPYPSTKNPDNQGAIVIGVGGDNSNNSWGTFYEGAVVTGYPEAATEQAVMDNVKAAGYGQ